MGHTQSSKLAKSPQLRMAYEMYLMCRSTQLVVFRKPVPNKRDGSEKIVTYLWPTGFTLLPHEGGVEEQSYLNARLLAAALRGEQQGVARSMAKP